MVGGEPSRARPELYGATPAKRNLHPIAELGAENCTEQMGVPGPWHERLPHFRMAFTPSSGKELQSEFFVPFESALPALRAINRLGDRWVRDLFISEVRTIAADELWMSPCYKRPSVAIHFTWKQNVDSVTKLIPVVEEQLAPFGARPHWGKLFSITPSQLRSRYERYADFLRLLKECDPAGKFRNAFLDSNLASA
jgi:xylitol oxidase